MGSKGLNTRHFYVVIIVGFYRQFARDRSRGKRRVGGRGERGGVVNILEY